MAVAAVITWFFVSVRVSSRMYGYGERGPLLFLLALMLLEIAEDPIRALHLGPQSYVVWGGLVLILCHSQKVGPPHGGRTRGWRGSVTSASHSYESVD